MENIITFSEAKQSAIPDPGERTGNDPCYLMSSTEVLRLIKNLDLDFFERAKGEVIRKCEITEEVVAPIKAAAITLGWSEVKMFSKQLLFIK